MDLDITTSDVPIDDKLLQALKTDSLDVLYKLRSRYMQRANSTSIRDSSARRASHSRASITFSFMMPICVGINFRWQ